MVLLGIHLGIGDNSYAECKRKNTGIKDDLILRFWLEKPDT